MPESDGERYLREFIAEVDSGEIAWASEKWPPVRAAWLAMLEELTTLRRERGDSHALWLAYDAACAATDQVSREITDWLDPLEIERYHAAQWDECKAARVLIDALR